MRLALERGELGLRFVDASAQAVDLGEAVGAALPGLGGIAALGRAEQLRGPVRPELGATVAIAAGSQGRLGRWSATGHEGGIISGGEVPVTANPRPILLADHPSAGTTPTCPRLKIAPRAVSTAGFAAGFAFEGCPGLSDRPPGHRPTEL